MIMKVVGRARKIEGWVGSSASLVTCDLFLAEILGSQTKWCLWWQGFITFFYSFSVILYIIHVQLK